MGDKTIGRRKFESEASLWLDHIANVLDAEFDDIAGFKPGEIVDIDFEERFIDRTVGIRMDNNFGIVNGDDAVHFSKALELAAQLASDFEYLGYEVVDDTDDKPTTEHKPVQATKEKARGMDYMWLPMDAGGEPIRVGDVMVGDDLYKLKVIGVYEDGFMWQDDMGNVSACDAGDYRHYHDSWDSIIADAEEVGRDWHLKNKNMSLDEHFSLIESLVRRCKTLAESDE